MRSKDLREECQRLRRGRDAVIFLNLHATASGHACPLQIWVPRIKILELEPDSYPEIFRRVSQKIRPMAGDASGLSGDVI